VLTAMGGSDVTIVFDSANHASVVDACRLPGSEIAIMPRGDLGGVTLPIDERSSANRGQPDTTRRRAKLGNMRYI